MGENAVTLFCLVLDLVDVVLIDWFVREEQFLLLNNIRRYHYPVKTGINRSGKSKTQWKYHQHHDQEHAKGPQLYHLLLGNSGCNVGDIHFGQVELIQDLDDESITKLNEHAEWKFHTENHNVPNDLEWHQYQADDGWSQVVFELLYNIWPSSLRSCIISCKSRGSNWSHFKNGAVSFRSWSRGSLLRDILSTWWVLSCILSCSYIDFLEDCK